MKSKKIESPKSQTMSALGDQSDMIIYTSKDGSANVALMTREGRVWLTQKQMAELFGTSVPSISMNIAKILNDRELDADSVIKQFLTTASDGKTYDTLYYSLEMILAVGYKVRGVRGVQFRQWATRHLSEYLVKGFTMDDERLKNPDGRPDYFDELLERIRDIRASEKRFYQKIRDLFKLSSDYETREKATQMFFAETQNKLLYAVTHQTAAEIVMSRADENKPNMGLMTWKGSVVRKGDIVIAKNYLSEEEVDALNRLTTIFLEAAEMRVKERRDLTLNFWRNEVNRLLEYREKDILVGSGSISNEQMEEQVRAIYTAFDARRKAFEALEAEKTDELILMNEAAENEMELVLKDVENKINH